MAAREDSGMPFSYFPVIIPQARGDQETTPTPVTEQWPLKNLIFHFDSEIKEKKKENTPTYFVVDLWKLSFHLLPLEEMILGLLTHRRNQIKLPGHRIRFLIKWQKKRKKKKGENGGECSENKVTCERRPLRLMTFIFCPKLHSLSAPSACFSIHFNLTQCHLFKRLGIFSNYEITVIR